MLHSSYMTSRIYKVSKTCATGFTNCEPSPKKQSFSSSVQSTTFRKRGRGESIGDTHGGNWQHGLGSKPGRVYSIWLNRQPNNPGLTPCNIPVEQLRGGIACVPLSSRLRQLGHRRNTRSFHLRHCRRILSDPHGLEPTVSCRS
jgi:hypothetical protein